MVGEKLLHSLLTSSSALVISSWLSLDTCWTVGGGDKPWDGHEYTKKTSLAARLNQLLPKALSAAAHLSFVSSAAASVWHLGCSGVQPWWPLPVASSLAAPPLAGKNTLASSPLTKCEWRAGRNGGGGEEGAKGEGDKRRKKRGKSEMLEEEERTEGRRRETVERRKGRRGKMKGRGGKVGKEGWGGRKKAEKGREVVGGKRMRGCLSS